MKWSSLIDSLRGERGAPPVEEVRVPVASPRPEAVPAPTRPATPSPAPKRAEPVAVAAPPAPGAAQERSHDRSLFKALLGSLYDAILVTDVKGNVIESNPRAELLFGYGAAELWSMPCQRLINEFSPLVLNKIITHVASGRFTMLNANGVRKDGGLFAAEIAIGPIHYLCESDLLLSIRSLERRKKGERKQALERDAAAFTTVALLIADGEGRIEYANPACVHLLHREGMETPVGRVVSEFCKAIDAAGPLLDLKPKDDQWAGQIIFQGPTGEDLPCRVTAVPLPAGRDSRPSIVATIIPGR
jgi:PAS domain S-box-containing protein